MKEIVILGAGTGGALVANMLDHRLPEGEFRITVIDRFDKHVYQPGLLFIPFRLYGYETEDDVVKPIEEPLPGSARFVHAQVNLIDHEHRKVETDHGVYSYDWLISALGCRLAPEEIEGMAEAMVGDNGVHTFYSLEGALRMQRAMDNMQRGRLVVNIAEMPIKCPVAPIEFAFLADYYFHRKGNRERVEIVFVTPFDGAFTKPNAKRILSGICGSKAIDLVPNFQLEHVDKNARTIHSYDGRTVKYDLLCAVPPNLGPQVLDDSELSDGTGYGMTHPRTLKSRKADRIYLMGDNTNVSASKAGSVAHFEGETVVQNILREMAGKPPSPSFDGHTNCFIESGYHKALLIDFNYDMEPLQGTFPLPHLGPFTLLGESHINHLGKLAFKWVYWNLLLPGHLPKVPLLPSHMSFLGKDVETAPQVRRSSIKTVGDVMQREVVTVRSGASLTEAAQLMAEHNVSGLPVVDEEDRLVGILSEADFLSALDVRGSGFVRDLFDTVIRRRRARKTMGTIVDDLMTKDPFRIKSEDSLQKAIETMDHHRIKRLVITDDDDHVRGVISRADLIKLYTLH